MKKKFLLPLMILFTATCSLGTMVGTLGWFVARTRINSKNNLGGAFLSQYFHCGDGSEDDPFVITKPFHYENMIKFHYEYESFAQAGYYFQFGSMDERMPGSPTSPVFYSTDENGNVDTTTTSETLDLGGKLLPPIGTEEFPFVGHLNGNDLNVIDFTIAGEGYYDIGIFGFVSSQGSGEVGSIHNCYWRNFAIDTSKSSNLVHKHDITANPGRAHYNEDLSTQVGYLAGHTVYAAAFTHCYLNNCDIVSNGTNAPSNTTYGYFGKVENDYLGGSTSKGDNYSFELDSEAIYRSTRQIYDNVSNNPIRTRSGYTEYSTPINGDNNEIYNNNGVYTTKYPLSSAISRNKAIDNNDTYRLEGKTPNSPNADRNYSFSTIGYQPTTTNTTPIEYETYYTRNSTNYVMPKNTVRKTDWDGSSHSTAISESGDYYYHNGSNWVYFHSENTANEGKSAKSFTINLGIPDDTVNFDGFAGMGTSGKVLYAAGFLYIDNVLIKTEDITSKVSCKPHSINIDIKHVKFTSTTVTTNLTRGIHYYQYYYLVKTETYPWLADTCQEYFWFSNSGNACSNTDMANLTIGSGTFTISQEQYDSSSRSINLDCSDYSHRTKTTNNWDFNVTRDQSAATASDIPQYINKNTFQAVIYGKNTATNAVSALSDTTLKWEMVEGTSISYDSSGNPIETSWNKWYARNTPERTVDASATTVYLSDNPDITPRVTDNGYVKGYEWQNIDIVGGGVSFYYRNFNFLNFDVRVISIPAESSSKYVCNAVPTADINNNAKFYATKYCPGSIVMYFKNSANAADEADRELGNITFKYVNASALGTSRLNISEPSFRKGSGSFKPLTDFGEITGDGVIDYETNFSATITESGAKQCSYCALDKDRKILGVFDTNGNPSTGFLNSDGTPNVSKLLQIDTYVIVLGSESDITNSSWVTNISFEYIAKEGYGGSFGTVEYRDLGGSVTATIFNFFVNNPENNKVYVNVIFRPDAFESGGITYPANSYYITVFSNTTVKVNIFLYDSNYHCVFNGTQYDSSMSDLESAPFS